MIQYILYIYKNIVNDKNTFTNCLFYGEKMKQENNNLKDNKNTKPKKDSKEILQANEEKPIKKSVTKKLALKKESTKKPTKEKEKSKILKKVKPEKNANDTPPPIKPVRNKKQTPLSEIERINASYNVGLTTKQAESRIHDGYDNVVKDANAKTIGSILFKNIFTFFNLLAFIVAAALIYVGAGFGNIFFVIIVLTNMTIGIIQEIKAKKTIEKIKLLTSPSAMVVRDGFLSEKRVSQIVLDDILYFETGKQISADCIIIDGEIEVNESLLTGESVSVKKKKGDLILSGSFVVGGKCYARCEKVGSSTYSAKLAEKAKQYSKPKSELLKSMRTIIRSIGIIIIPFAVAMFYTTYQTNDFRTTVESTAGLVIGMIPAGMFLLTSMALAAGVLKLASKRTLVQDLYSIEMLARTDVLCLDKTGTITDGSMKVSEIVPLNDKFSQKQISDRIGSMLTALDDNNQTSRALVAHFGYSKEHISTKTLPFTSSRKLSAVSFKSGDTYILGAPEFVLRTRSKKLDEKIKMYAKKGMRVIILASCSGTITNDKLPASRQPVALIIIEDHIRENAVETIAWFRENGVDIKIISGDSPITVSEVSRRVGVENADKYINLEGLNEQQVVDAVSKYTVFGRVSPEQKAYIVRALKNKGRKVAMTGDGVNDILALKEADCSIAMASGSEATRHVSHLVLLDSNFSSMPAVVAEGRRVVNNVQSSSSLFLMKTLFTILLATFCLIYQKEYPFKPSHMLLMEICVIGIPSFFLALQLNKSRIKGKFLNNLLMKSLPAAILFFGQVLICYFLVRVNLIDEIKLYTVAALVVTFSSLFVLYRICKPYDVYRGVLFASMVLMIAILLNFAYGVFSYEVLNLTDALFIALIVQTLHPLYAVLVRWFEALQDKQAKNKSIKRSMQNLSL